MLAHALRGAGHATRAGWSAAPIGGGLANARVGRGRVAGGRGRRVGPLDAEPAAWRSRCSRTSSSTTTPPSPRWRSCARRSRVPARAALRRSCGTAPSCWRCATGPLVAYDARDADARPRAARASTGAGTRCAGGARAPTTRSTPPARSRRPGWPAPTPARAIAGAGGLPRRRPALPAARAQRARARWSTTTTRTTRPRSRRRCGRRARSSTGGWWRCSSRTCSRARRCSRASSARRWRWPTWWSCSTSTRRASAPRTSRASAGC